MKMEQRIRRLERLLKHNSEHSKWLSQAIATLGLSMKEIYSSSNSLLLHSLREFDNADESRLSLLVGNLLAGEGVFNDSRVQILVKSLPQRRIDNSTISGRYRPSKSQ